MNALTQPYGIQLWGDFLGTLCVFGVYGLISAYGLPSVYKKWWAIFSWTLSTWGSLTILPRAIMRFDPLTFVYHAIWVSVGVWVVATLWRVSWDQWMSRFDNWEVRMSSIWINYRSSNGEHEEIP